jgi:hypothetical protein
MRYPYLPHKYKTNTGIKLVFPLGRWRGFYTHFELNKALSLGYEIEEIKQCYIYKNSFFPFRQFVDDLYNLRMKFKKEGSPMELGVKLLLNSLYGKTASRHVSEVDFIDLDNMTKDEVERFMFESGRIIEMKNDKLGIETTKGECTSSYVFPILAVYTTAYAREILYQYLTTNKALYCDTDSILTDQMFKESKELGKMKIEYDVLTGIVIKPKMYMYFLAS